MSLNKNVLKNVLSKTYNFCGICFGTLEENSVHLNLDMQDEIVISNENTLKVSDMLYSVLGEEVMTVISTFKYVCKQCIKSAVCSYKFVTMSKENTTALKISLENLTSTIEKATENHYFYKSLFITIDPQDFSTQEFFEFKSPARSLSSPCPKIETFDSKEQESIKEESAENFVQKSRNKVKKKRSNYSSVNIKTTDMLYDKNDLSNAKCKCCKRSYPSLSNLRNHYIRVHAPKNFKCPTCNRKFGSSGLLEQHKHQSHCTLVCTECGKTFYNRHTLKMHEMGHYIRIVCEDCGRVYKSQTTYKNHIDLNVCGRKTRANPSNATFTCDYCNKKYTQKVSLRVHIQYEHGNHKAHVCKWCNKKFWAHSRLKAHIVKHTQEKKFTCDICSGKFVSKESLLYHTRIHTGEKPYKCHLCDSYFLSASRRADHIKRLHAAHTFKCELCHAVFVTQSCLDKHKKTHLEVNTRKEKQNVPDIFDGEDHLIYFRIPGDEIGMNQKTDKTRSVFNDITSSREESKSQILELGIL